MMRNAGGFEVDSPFGPSALEHELVSLETSSEVALNPISGQLLTPPASGTFYNTY
jgi:hypothetical protein